MISGGARRETEDRYSGFLIKLRWGKTSITDGASIASDETFWIISDDLHKSE